MAGTQETTKIGQWKNEAVAVLKDSTGTLQDIICPHGATRLTITIENAGATNAFDAFVVSIRSTVTSDFVSHASSAADFTTSIKLPMVYASASPVTLAGATSVIFQYDVSGLDAVRLAASNATAIGSANIYYHFGA